MNLYPRRFARSGQEAPGTPERIARMIALIHRDAEEQGRLDAVEGKKRQSLPAYHRGDACKQGDHDAETWPVGTQARYDRGYFEECAKLRTHSRAARSIVAVALLFVALPLIGCRTPCVDRGSPQVRNPSPPSTPSVDRDGEDAASPVQPGGAPRPLASATPDVRCSNGRCFIVPTDPVTPRAPSSYADPVVRPLRITESRDPLDASVTHGEVAPSDEGFTLEPETWGDTPREPVAEAPPVPTFPDVQEALIEALADERDALRCRVADLDEQVLALLIVSVAFGLGLIVSLIFNRR